MTADEKNVSTSTRMYRSPLFDVPALLPLFGGVVGYFLQLEVFIPRSAARALAHGKILGWEEAARSMALGILGSAIVFIALYNLIRQIDSKFREIRRLSDLAQREQDFLIRNAGRKHIKD